MTVVELWPFGGWYTEILAPYLRDHGLLYEAAMDPASTNGEDMELNSELKAMFAAHPKLFDKVRLSVLAPGKMQIAPGRYYGAANFANAHADPSGESIESVRLLHHWRRIDIASNL